MHIDKPIKNICYKLQKPILECKKNGVAMAKLLFFYVGIIFVINLISLKYTLVWNIF